MVFSVWDLELGKWFATGSNKATREESKEEILEYLIEYSGASEEGMKSFWEHKEETLHFFNVEIREHEGELTVGDW